MASPCGQRRWPSYPHIPIFLETSDDNGTTRCFRTISPISPSARSRPQDRPLQYLAAISTQFTNLSPVSPATQFTNLSPIWPIPESTPEIQEQPPRRPTLRFFATAKPRIQLHPPPTENAQPAGHVIEEHRHDNGHGDSGLGIVEGSSIPLPEPATSPAIEKTDGSSNIAQRIEEKIWRYNRSGNVIKRWLLEIISWLISALCMAAIIGVLIGYRDHPLPKWRWGLTLNALIAVLSKLSGAALLLPVSEALGQLKWSWFQGNSKTMWDFEIFDNASRGPWGSFLLLIRIKGKALAAFGALITLFSLALDPFFQQVVDFPERWTLVGNSSIPRVIRYAPLYGVEIKGGQPVATTDQAIEVVAEQYFYDNGTQPMVFGNGTRPDIPLSCPSSKCIWPPYETLGICSKCQEVPELLTYGCHNTTMDWVQNVKGPTAKLATGTMCGYFLNFSSDNPVLMSGFEVDDTGATGEILLTRVFPLVSNPKREQYWGGSINFKNIRNPIVDALIVGTVDGAEGVLRQETPVTHECVISWCVKTIQSSYYLATYEEHVTQTFINTTNGPFPWLQSTHFESSNLNGTETYYMQDVAIEAPLNGQNTSQYGVSNDTAFKTIFTFDSVFPSFVTQLSTSAQPFMRYKVAQKGPMLRTLQYNPWTPYNVTRHMERLATSLTNVIRSSADKDMVEGWAFSEENFVLVRWTWLALPLGLLILSLIFLVATVIKTSKESDQIGVWKTSALATLLYGLPDHYQTRLADPSVGGIPRARAKKLKVKLLPKKGWRVSGNLFSPVTPNLKRNQPPPGWI